MDSKVFDSIDARCNREVWPNSIFVYQVIKFNISDLIFCNLFYKIVCTCQLFLMGVLCVGFFFFFFFSPVLTRCQPLVKSFVLSLSICTHVCLRLPCDGTGFLEIIYRRLEKLEIRSKSGIIIGHFIWRPKRTPYGCRRHKITIKTLYWSEIVSHLR